VSQTAELTLNALCHLETRSASFAQNWKQKGCKNLPVEIMLYFEMLIHANSPNNLVSLHNNTWLKLQTSQYSAQLAV